MNDAPARRPPRIAPLRRARRLVSRGLVLLGGILPLGYQRRLGYYIFFLAFEFVGAYFLIASVWYWVITNRV